MKSISYQSMRRIIGQRWIKIFLEIRRSLGQNIKVGKGFYYRSGCSLVVGKEGQLVIGKNVFFNHNCSVNCLAKIQIGDQVMFGENVHLYDHNHKHQLGAIPFSEQGYKKGKIVIGNNCWIGTNTVILQGVEIGENVVIGANCVIYKKIPSNSVVTNSASLVIRPQN